MKERFPSRVGSVDIRPVGIEAWSDDVVLYKVGSQPSFSSEPVSSHSLGELAEMQTGLLHKIREAIAKIKFGGEVKYVVLDDEQFEATRLNDLQDPSYRAINPNQYTIDQIRSDGRTVRWLITRGRNPVIDITRGPLWCQFEDPYTRDIIIPSERER